MAQEDRLRSALNLAEQSRTDLEIAKRRALRARGLLENDDFKWWIGELRENIVSTTHKLVYIDMNDTKRHTYRGIIQGVERALHGLAKTADSLDSIDKKLEILDERDRQRHTSRKRWGI